MHLFYLDCIFHSNGKKVLLSFRNGKDTKHSDVQFDGRVQVERSKGVLKITLSDFGPDDAGNYTCEFSDAEQSDRGKLMKQNFAHYV